jgi:integrase
MPKVNLTDRKLRSLVSDRRTFFWDDSLAGFGVRVTPEGRKTFVVRYRSPHSGRRPQVTIGTYRTVSLADARDRAKGILAEVALGDDPAGVIATRKAAPTFVELSNEYIERHAKPKKKSWRYDQRMIDGYLLEPWGDRKAAEIDRFEVMRLLDEFMDRGSPQAAIRVRALVSKIFNFGVSRGYVDANPVAAVPRPAETSRRERVLTKDEIRRVWTALNDETPVMAATFRLRLLTAQRGMEVMSMRHEDLDGDWWTIPPERSKNKLAHRVPLSQQALAELETVKLFNEDSAWIFPSPNDSGHIRWVQKAAQALRERSAVYFWPHDLRRTAATFIASMGTDRTVLSRILNHADKSVTATYDRSTYDIEKRRALVAWGDRVEQIVTGKAAEEKVVGRIG